MPEGRVIFVNRVYWPSTTATAQLLTDLAEGLAHADWSVHVIAAGSEAGVRNGVTIHRTGTGEQLGGLFSRAFTYRRFLRAAKHKLGQVVAPGDLVVPLTDPPMLGATVTAVALARGAQVIPWIQDIYPEIAAVHFGRLAGLLLAPLQAERNHWWLASQGCVTLGADMAATLAGQGVPPDQITVIPNWAPRELHHPAMPAEVAVQRVAWGVADKFVVAYSGNLGRVHEFATILKTADELRAEPGIVFLFIGSGARFEAVKSAAQQRGLNNLRFLPPVPRSALAASLAAADAHLVTLKPAYTGLVYPSKLAGVFAAGRPVLFVGPIESSIAHLISQADSGVSRAPGDGAGLVAVIRQWQAETEVCRRLGSNARTAYEREFTEDAALAAWTQLLRTRRVPALP